MKPKTEGERCRAAANRRFGAADPQNSTDRQSRDWFEHGFIMGARSERAQLRRCLARDAAEIRSRDRVMSTARTCMIVDTKRITRLTDMLVRADSALAVCGVAKRAPIRVDIQEVLRTA